MKKGITRIVFVFRNFVIKIPNFTYSHLHFLEGCRANWYERCRTKINKNNKPFYVKIAPTYFSLWFGLLNIQHRAIILTRDLEDNEIEYFSDVTTETKFGNFGYINKRLVCVDYA